MPRVLVASQNSRPVRLLTIISTLTRGGTERAAVNCALGYKAQGFPSAVLAFKGGGVRREVLERAGVEIFAGGEDKASIAGAVELAREWQPDILHLHRPGITDEDSAFVVGSLITPYLRVFETNVFGYVDGSADRELFDIHFQLSRWCMWKWCRAAGNLHPPSFSVVVPYSVDVAPFHPASEQSRASMRESLGIPAGAVVFGRVGQADLIKWSPMLIESFAAVASRRRDAWLMVVGLPEPLRARVEQLPSEIRSRIRQPPMADDDAELSRYYSAMDIFVHASQKGESFGMVLCEAMLCGLAVITVSTPLRDNSQIEVVKHGRTGLVVDGRDGLTQAMHRLAEDADLRRRMGAAGPGWVTENFSIEKVAPRQIRLAEIALAAGSREELTEAIGQLRDFRNSNQEDTPRSILRDSGLPRSFSAEALATLVNSGPARAAIRWVRAATRPLRGG